MGYCYDSFATGLQYVSQHNKTSLLVPFYFIVTGYKPSGARQRSVTRAET